LHELNITRSRAEDSIEIQSNVSGTLTVELREPTGGVVHVYKDEAVGIGQSIAIPLSLPSTVAPGAYQLEIRLGSTLRVITLEN
jgi:hypothetical protein